LVRPVAPRFEPSDTSSDPGLERFVSDDFGLLDLRRHPTGTLPWKLAATALVLTEAPKLGITPDRAALVPVLEQYGLFAPESVLNGPSSAGAAWVPGQIIGQTHGVARSRLGGLEIEVRSPGCALCHAGRLRGADGRPTRLAWLGLPNDSLDLDGLNRALRGSIRLALRDEAGLLRAMKLMFPEVSVRELRTYEKAVLPRLRHQVTTGGASGGLPFENGGAGTVNNVAGRLLASGALVPDALRAERAPVTSIPILTHRAFRSSLMWDGSYARPGATRFEPVTVERAAAEGSAKHAGLLAVFSIGEGGTHPSRVSRRMDSFEEVATSLDALGPPVFPGSVDLALAEAGGKLFAQWCSSCHGQYERQGGRPRLTSYPNRLVPVETIGTDPVRAVSVSAALGSMRAQPRARAAFLYADVEATSGYVAPLLDGLWATAPYLHNGSVPTLWHLMHPDRRPTTFEVGGHRLDYDRMGIDLADEGQGEGQTAPAAEGLDRHLRFPSGWTPTSLSSIYDTRLPGRSAAGHGFPFNRLTEGEKRRVLEFLKEL